MAAQQLCLGEDSMASLSVSQLAVQSEDAKELSERMKTLGVENGNQGLPNYSVFREDNPKEALTNFTPTFSNGQPEISEVAPITITTLEEERKLIESRFLYLRQNCSVDGDIMEIQDPEEIFDWMSVLQIAGYDSACAFQISNFSSCNLSDYREYLENGTIMKTPVDIRSGESKVVLLQDRPGAWSLLYSLKILPGVRLTLMSSFDSFGSLKSFGIAFTPEDVPMDKDLFERLEEISNAPDICVQQCPQNGLYFSSDRGPTDLYIQRGIHLACARIKRGGKTLINVDILEDIFFSSPPSTGPTRSNNAVFRGSLSLTNNASFPFWENSSDEVACLIQMENYLPVQLINGRYLFRDMSYTGHDFMPTQIQPFSQDVFFVTSGMRIKALFLYEIKSTDLTLSVALTINGWRNSFSVAFEKSPLVLNQSYLERLKNPNQWNIHIYKKHSFAKAGQQVIQRRNIRAEVLMTTGGKASLKVRLLTF